MGISVNTTKIEEEIATDRVSTSHTNESTDMIRESMPPENVKSPIEVSQALDFINCLYNV